MHRNYNPQKANSGIVELFQHITPWHDRYGPAHNLQKTLELQIDETAIGRSTFFVGYRPITRTILAKCLITPKD